MEELKQIVIRGTVTDTKTGEPIPGANVYLKSDRTNSAFSNEQGFFFCSKQHRKLPPMCW